MIHDFIFKIQQNKIGLNLGDERISNLLIKHGANVDGTVEYMNNASPLVECIRYGHDNIVDLLITNGVNISSPFNHYYGDDPLHLAVTMSMNFHCFFLLQYIAVAYKIDILILDNTKIVDKLIKNGAEIDGENSHIINLAVENSKKFMEPLNHFAFITSIKIEGFY